MPGNTSTKAPKSVKRFTLPSMTSPAANFCSTPSHGPGCVAFNDNDTRPSTSSIARTLTSTSSPTVTADLGDTLRSCDNSVKWTKPSTPPRSMNAPKLVIRATLPVTTSPTDNLPNTSARTAAASASTTSRRDKIKRFSDGSTSLIFASNSWPTKRSVLRVKRLSIIEAGMKPRRPSNSTARPPLTARVTLTVTTSSSRPTSLSHALRASKRFLDTRYVTVSVSLPTTWRSTSNSSVSPTLTRSLMSASRSFVNSRRVNTPSTPVPEIATFAWPASTVNTSAVTTSPGVTSFTLFNKSSNSFIKNLRQSGLSTQNKIYFI